MSQRELEDQRSKLKPTTTVVRENTFIDATPINNNKYTNDDDEIREFYESDVTELKKKISELVKLIQSSKYIVAYTGAGLSTSTGIPDYRGPSGAWTLKEKGLRLTGTKDIESACPSFSHMSLTQLYKNNIIKHIVTTNLDGLHRRADTPREVLAILHGDAYEEKCAKCQKKFFRDFDCTKYGTKKDHKTGRTCEECGGDLLDSIINFGENLPEEEFSRAFEESKKADLTLVFGTSMLVRPACNLPIICPQENGGKMVICNKQKTPFDNLASVRIFADLDDIFVLLMDELKIQVPTQTSQGMPIQFPLIEYIPRRLKEAKQGLINKQEQKNEKKEVVEKKKTGEIEQLKTQIKTLGFGSAFSRNQDTKRFIHVSNTNSLNVYDDLKKQTLAFFDKCSNSEFLLKGNCAKTIIDSCSNIKIILNATHMAGHLEIINSSKIYLIIENHIPTMTADNVSDFKLELATFSVAPTLFIHKCNLVSLSIRSDTGENVFQKVDEENKNQNDQMRIRVSSNRNTDNLYGLVQEVVIREGNGYATTAEEKKRRDELDEKNKRAMMMNMQNIINFKTKQIKQKEEQKGLKGKEEQKGLKGKEEQKGLKGKEEKE